MKPRMPTKSEEQEFKIIAESAGAIYRGVQCDAKAKPLLVMFDEPHYQTTLSLRLTEFTKQNVAKRLSRAVELFASCENKF